MSGGGIDQLVKMANDIGTFFSGEPDHDVAVAGVVNHIQKFWDPRMRRKLVAHLQAGGHGMLPLVKVAAAQIAQTPAAAV